jgi:serine/threonine protein kinase
LTCDEKAGLLSASCRLALTTRAFNHFRFEDREKMSNHGNKSNAGASLLAPDTILQSRYRIVRQLGRGGMGAVYEAVDLRLGHTIALKQTLTCDESMWKQFEQEARMMALLNHPVLPRVSDYFTEQNRAFFVMQFVEGSDLSEIIAQQPGPFPRHAVVAWADQLLDALIYLHSHERQIVHRDIKPHNLRITPSGQIALLDFGLAKTQVAASATDTPDRSVFGYTPRYAPLEQIQDLGTTPQSDIYALGATLYHLFTGVKPPDALTRATALISSRPNPLLPAHELNRAVGPELSAVLMRAMAQNPNERYASAIEFREALRRIGREEKISELEFVAHGAPINASVMGDPNTILVGAMKVNKESRLGSHAIAAVFVMLLTAFGVFCNYYPWKLPAASTTEAVRTNVATLMPEAMTNDDKLKLVTSDTNRARKTIKKIKPIR